MRTLSRLDSLSSNLVAAYRRANQSQRRKAIVSVCSAVVSQTGLQGNEVGDALATLRDEKTEDYDMCPKIVHLAAELDEEYLKLSEETAETTPEVMILFRKARAAAALAAALSRDPSQFEEAIYEAIIGSTDQIKAIQLVESALSTV